MKLLRIKKKELREDSKPEPLEWEEYEAPDNYYETPKGKMDLFMGKMNKEADKFVCAKFNL